MGQGSRNGSRSSRRNSKGFRTVNIQNLIGEEPEEGSRDMNFGQHHSNNMQIDIQPSHTGENAEHFILETKEYKLEDKLDKKFKGKYLSLGAQFLTSFRFRSNHDRQ